MENSLFNSRESEKNLLQKLYWGENLSTPKIAEKLGINKGIVYFKMKRYGIPIRNLSEAMKIVHPKGIPFPNIKELQKLDDVSVQSSVSISFKIEEIIKKEMRDSYNKGFEDGKRSNYIEAANDIIKRLKEWINEEYKVEEKKEGD